MTPTKSLNPLALLPTHRFAPHANARAAALPAEEFADLVEDQIPSSLYKLFKPIRR